MLARLLRRRPDPKAQLSEVLGTAALPVFPAVGMEVLGMLRDPGVGMGKVGQVLAQDPGLSVAVLRACNSAAFGLPRKVSAVPHAASLLGRRQVEGIVLAKGVKQMLPKGTRGGLDPNRFWALAARRATIARSLSQRLDPASADLSFTAALLQDMSLPLLCHHRPDAYAPLVAAWRAGEVCLHEAERDRLGWDHAQVGGWMGESWGLGPDLVGALEDHHGDHAPPAVELVGLLGETPGDGGAGALVERAVSRFGLPAAEVEKALVEAAAGAEALGSVLR